MKGRERMWHYKKDGDEKGEVERKIVASQRIVSGGESPRVDKLFGDSSIVCAFNFFTLFCQYF